MGWGVLSRIPRPRGDLECPEATNWRLVARPRNFDRLPTRRMVFVPVSSIRRFVGLASLALVVAAPRSAAAQQHLPDRLTDAEFWQLVGSISEPGGYFRMDNWTSNEMEVGRVVHHAPRQRAHGRRVYGRRARTELQLHRVDQAGDGVHRRHPPPGGDAASHVQGDLRDVEGPRRLHLDAVLPAPSRRRGQPDADRPALDRLRPRDE